MPYQNLDSEIVLALAIWLLAILIFVFMIVLVVAQLIAERRSQMSMQQNTVPKPRGNFLRTALRIFQRGKES